MDESSRYHAPHSDQLQTFIDQPSSPRLSTKSCSCSNCLRNTANIQLRMERFATRRLARGSSTGSFDDKSYLNIPHVQQALARRRKRLCHPKQHHLICAFLVKPLVAVITVGVLLYLFYSNLAMGFNNIMPTGILSGIWLPKTGANTWYKSGDNLACCGALIIPSWTTSSADLKAGPPYTLLDNEGDVPESTWCFEGTIGHVGIVLRSPGVLSHISVKVVTHLHGLRRLGAFWGLITSAPKEVICWGLVDGSSTKKKIGGLPGISQPIAIPLAGAGSYRFIPIAQFEYDGRETAPSVQTVGVNPILSEAQIEFGLIMVEFRSNWGAHETCLNRVFVHRKENVGKQL